MKTALVYMLAGISSRFGGKPKGLAKIGPKGETLLEYSLNQAIPSGFSKIIFIVGEKTESLFKEKFGNEYRGIPIYYAMQTFNPEERDKPWGTTDALCCAKELIDCSFIVCNGDDIYGEETFSILAEHLKKENSDAAVGYKLGEVLSEDGGVNRGIFEIENSKAKSITETFEIKESNLSEKNLTEDNLCSMNIFALTPKTLNLLNKSLIKFKEENKGSRTAECFLPNQISKLIAKNKTTLGIFPTTSRWLGLTVPEDEEKARTKLAN